MVRRCIVRGCCGGMTTINPNEPHITLFSVPKDPELFNAWKLNLPELRKPLDTSSWVCEKHFNSRDVISHYTQILPTGTWRYPRGVKRLQPKAVPTLVNTCETSNGTMLHADNETIENNINTMNTTNLQSTSQQEYLTNNSEHMDVQIQSSLNVIYDASKSPSDKINSSELISNISRNTSTLNYDTMNAQEIPMDQHNNCEVPFSFNTLLMNLDNLKYPEVCKWSYTVTPDKKTIIFVSSPTDGILRRVDIYFNLSTKVLMDCCCVHSKYLPKKLENMDKVAKFLTTVYNWNLCKTLRDSKRFIQHDVCEAIAPRNENNLGRPTLRCMSCVVKLEAQQYRKLPPRIRVKKALKRKCLVQKMRRYKKK